MIRLPGFQRITDHLLSLNTDKWDHTNTLSLNFECINSVNHVVSRRGKGISIALAVRSLDLRLRRKRMIGLKHHIHCYSSELVKVTQVATYKILGV